MSPQNNNILLPVVFKIKPGQDFKAKVSTEEQRSNQGYTMMMHTYTPYQYQVSVSYPLSFLSVPFGNI